MKLNKRHSVAGMLLAIALFSGCSQREKPKPPDYHGSLGVTDTTRIVGWAWDKNRPDAPVSVDIYDGNTLLTTVTADQFRKDLVDAGIGNGKHGFVLETPAALKDNQRHEVTAKIASNEFTLANSPRVIAPKSP